MKKYSIGTVGFKFKKDAYVYTKNIVQSLGAGTVVDPDHVQYQFLCDLTKYQPDYFRITQNAMNRSALHLEKFENEEYEGLSWVKASKFDFTYEKPQKMLCDALREAIVEDILEFKLMNPDKHCVQCKTTENIQVDHKIAFDKIKNDFLTQNPDCPRVFDNIPGTYRWLFKDSDYVWRKKWQKYHASKACYQYLCRTCNIRKSNK